ncbi:hypothetical protein SAMN05216490_1191 [Mucilaginibacter mallensis]|uniref:Histidine phosphatase superfamily (Branch 1) n=2 Tax=Mucilaginibacter mallensis TaxID=652787 RepID=A0A1H1SDA2_MUCMA|nr:hypothetical protein SAMN05216490_1191 [Mucilaginibacter mallensis]
MLNLRIRTMKKINLVFLLFLVVFSLSNCNTNAQNKTLKLVFIRHAERPQEGENLNCQGINRSLQLPAVLYKKFGIPQNIYVPELNMGKKTKRARMLQTITPFVAKYNVSVNSAFEEEDYKGVGKALLNENGTIFIVWEHNNIAPILEYLGITSPLKWKDSDFDSIWIVTFPHGSAVLTKDAENLHPAAGCPF